MRLHDVFVRDDCAICASASPTCNCSADEECVFINMNCNACTIAQCVAKSASSSSSSNGVGKGALAGAIVGALIFLAAALALLFWYRRQARQRNRATAPEAKPDIPARAETVLQRPDPIEKPPAPPTEFNTVRVFSTSSTTTIDLDPDSQSASAQTSAHTSYATQSNRSDPFSDCHSIQTAVTEGTNVIPIALVPPESHRDTSTTSIASGPVRPPRSPDLNLNLDHVNVSNDTLRPAQYALSQRSGISVASSRNSYLSSASFSSDILNEAPMIITPSKGAVRQVLGVVKAEVISASPTPSEGLKPTLSARPSVRSPLAIQSFTSGDLSGERDNGSTEGNPFSDKHVSTNATVASSPAPSTTTFGAPSPRRSSHAESDLVIPALPWTLQEDNSGSRPSSISTQAGSVIDIGSATRVNVGLSSPQGLRSPYRTTMGKIVTPSTTGRGTLEEQQQRALAHAHAQAQAQGLERGRRISASSVLSATSTRADSILESFPFVPPSPISNRPARTPPVSPLTQQTFSTSTPPSPLGKQVFTKQETPDVEQELTVPSRHFHGMSTASQLSTVSSGLGSFPFHIEESKDSALPSPMPDSATFMGRKRASLDTLAITSDLSSYPLGYDRSSVSAPQKQN